MKNNKRFFSSIKNILSSKSTTIEQLHEFRITTKTIRYSLEFLQRAYNYDFTEEITLLKQIQQYLGQIHDIDIFLIDIKSTLGILPYKDISSIIEFLQTERNNLSIQFIQFLYFIEKNIKINKKLSYILT